MSNEYPERLIAEQVAAAREIAKTDPGFNAIDDFYAFAEVMWSDDERKGYGMTSVEYQDLLQAAWHRRSQWSFPPSHYKKPDWFDNHVEVVGPFADKIKDALRKKVEDDQNR